MLPRYRNDRRFVLLFIVRRYERSTTVVIGQGMEIGGLRSSVPDHSKLELATGQIFARWQVYRLFEVRRLSSVVTHWPAPFLDD